MRDYELLSGQSLSDRIRSICGAKEVDCAVAFISELVRDDVFPRWTHQKVRIVCDISMGCNAQAALIAYGAPDNSDLRVCDGLHAKIYISAAGAIVGSPNLSRNGVGLVGQPAGNIEAGVFFAPDTPGWHDARRLFETLWKSPTIDPAQLERAPMRTRDPGRRIGPGGPQDPSLLERVKAYPERFASVLFVAEHRRIKDRQKKKERGRYDAAEQAGEFESKKRTLILRAPHAVFPAIPSNVLMFWRDGRNAERELLAYTDVVSTRSRRYTTLWGLPSWKGFWKVQRTIPPKRALTTADEAFLTGMADGSWVRSAADLSLALLDRG